MAEKKIVDAEVQEVQAEQQEAQVVGEIHIKVMDDGGLQLHVPEDSREFTPTEIEQVTRMVYDQLRDGRVASLAVEMFKSKLG